MTNFKIFTKQIKNNEALPTDLGLADTNTISGVAIKETSNGYIIVVIYK